MESASGETLTGPPGLLAGLPVILPAGLPVSLPAGLLGVPGLSGSWDGDEDEDEEEAGGIKPKSSPCPRRKSSVSSEDSEPELPPSRSRRVSFADVLGLSLVSVKEFDTWDVPRLPGDLLEGDRMEVEEYYLSTLFTLPLPSEELALRVREQKLELESLELLPGSSILRGVIRVLNLSFDKMLYVRTSLDEWASHFDLLAEYVPGSGDGVTDCFSFKLTLVPPFGPQGARVDFCLRYETPIGTFWANNGDRNYVLFCHQKVKETKEKLQSHNAQKKSCLKAISQIFTTEEHLSSTDAEHTGAAKHDNQPGANTEHMGTSEEEQQILMVENRLNRSRRNRRQEARMALVREHFSQREDTPDDNADRAVEPSEPLTQHNTLPVTSLSNGPQTQPQNDTSNREETLSVSMTPSDKAARPSTNEAEGSQDFVSAVGPITSDLVGSEVTMLSNHLAILTDKHGPSCQTDEHTPSGQSHGMSCDTLVEDRDESEGVEFPEDVLISAGPMSQTSSVTFGTVLAPLYHQVFSQVESDSQDVTDKQNQTSLSKGRWHDRKPATGFSQRYTSTQEIDCGLSLTSDDGETYVEQSGSQREALELDAHCLVLGLSVQSKPVCDETDRCVPRTGGEAEDPTALTPTVPQGPSEENNLAKRKTSAQIPTELTSTQTQTVVSTISASAQSEIDMVGLQTLIPVPQVPDSPSTGMVLQTSWGLDHVSGELPEDRGRPLTAPAGERPSGTDRLHQASCGMSELEDSDLRVKSSTTQMPNHPSIESKPSAHTLNADYCVAPIKQDDLVFHKFLSDNWCGETNLLAEAEGGGNVCDMKGVLGYDSESKEGDTSLVKFTEKDVGSVEDNDGSLKDPHFNGRQKCDDQNLEEKDWEKIVEEEEDVLLDEDGEEESKTDQEKDGNSDESANKVLEEMMEKEKLVEQENILVEEKENEEIYGDKCRIEETKERRVKLDEKGVDMEKREVEMDERGVEIEVEVLKDDIKEEDDDELQLEEKEMVEEEKMVEEDEEERLNEDSGEEILIGRGEVVEIGNQDEPSNRKQDQITAKTQHGAADHILTAEHRNSAFESVSEVDRVNAYNSKNMDAEDGRWERSEANLYIVQDAVYDDCCDHDNDQFSVVREDVDSVKGDGPLRAGKCCHDDGDERSISSESLSDDEMDLYLHSMKAMQKQGMAPGTTGCSKDIPGVMSLGKRPSISRSKHLPSPMPSISESVDEEQHDDALEDLLDFEKVEEPPLTPLSALFEGEEGAQNNLAWWRETFSFQNVSKVLMFSLLFVVFSVVAYYYDFLACSALYLLSVLWLCCQGEKQTPKKFNRVQEGTETEPVNQEHPSV